jgi:hypothetical protein
MHKERLWIKPVTVYGIDSLSLILVCTVFGCGIAGGASRGKFFYTAKEKLRALALNFFVVEALAAAIQ